MKCENDVLKKESEESKEEVIVKAEEKETRRKWRKLV